MKWFRRFNSLPYEVKSYHVSVASFVVSTLLALAGFYIAYISFQVQRFQEAESKRQQKQEDVRRLAQERADNLDSSKKAAEAFRSDGVEWVSPNP